MRLILEVLRYIFSCFSTAFSGKKMFKFWLKFWQNLFHRTQLTISQHCFGLWLCIKLARSHYMNQCWPSSMMQSLCHNELISQHIVRDHYYHMNIVLSQYITPSLKSHNFVLIPLGRIVWFINTLRPGDADMVKKDCIIIGSDNGCHLLGAKAFTWTNPN